MTIRIYDRGGRRIIGMASMHDPEKTCSMLQLMPETLNPPRGPAMKEHEAHLLLQELASDKTFLIKSHA